MFYRKMNIKYVLNNYVLFNLCEYNANTESSHDDCFVNEHSLVLLQMTSSLMLCHCHFYIINCF